jgi:uncharacterized protein YecE (DUF72 family)
MVSPLPSRRQRRSRTPSAWRGADAALDAFLEQVTGLGGKLGPLLFQLRPSLAFDPQPVGAFFAALRALDAIAPSCPGPSMMFARCRMASRSSRRNWVVVA